VPNEYVSKKIKGKSFQEHRLILAQILNRPLKPKEAAHHINGNKKDNRVTNLMLFETDGDHARFERRNIEAHIIFDGRKYAEYLRNRDN
jgi:hypothetical protein